MKKMNFTFLIYRKLEKQKAKKTGNLLFLEGEKWVIELLELILPCCIFTSKCVVNGNTIQWSIKSQIVGHVSPSN